jgi:hypothetical protein
MSIKSFFVKCCPACDAVVRGKKVNGELSCANCGARLAFVRSWPTTLIIGLIGFVLISAFASGPQALGAALAIGFVGGKVVRQTQNPDAGRAVADDPSSQTYTFEVLDRARRLARRILFVDVFLVLIVGLVLGFAGVALNARLFPPYGWYAAGMGLGEWILVFTLVTMVVMSAVDAYRFTKLLNKGKPSKRLILLGSFGMFFVFHEMRRAAEESGYRLTPLMGALKTIDR